MNVVLAIAGADATERMRRFAFIITIAAALYAGYLYVPGAASAYHTVIIHGHTGIYNSAFYGATIAALTGGFLTLFGFFLVRGSVERDVECNVDAIVGASPVRKMTFVFSKWLSNAAVLWAVGGISYVAAIGMQIIRGDASHFDPLAYVMPYLLLTVPAMGFVAAVAVTFDLIPFLRGVLGSVVFVILWPVMLTASLTAKNAMLQLFDPLGLRVIASNLIAAEQRAFPGASVPDVNFGIIVTKHLGEPFLFSGFAWTGAALVQRMSWLAIAALAVLAASVFFDRFRREQARKSGGPFIDLTRMIPNIPLFRIFRAEFGLLVNGASTWWYLGATGLIAAGAFVPLDKVTNVILPLALIWGLERISSLGARERRFGVDETISCTPGFASKTLAFQCAAGALLVLALCSTCVFRLTFAGDPMSIIACVMVAAAISAAALSFGALFGVSRAFEAFFLIAWYLGPVQHLPGLDFASGMLTSPIAVSVVCAAVAALALCGTAARRITTA